MVERINPSAINIELSNSCNLKCTTCSRSYTDIKVGHMKLEDAKRIIDSLKGQVKVICLSVFGEIFTYPYLYEVVTYIKSIDKDIRITITTNATLPNSGIIYERVIDYIDRLTISLDGINETYNAIRKNANFEDVLMNIDKLSLIAKKRGKEIELNMVVIEENYRQMADIIELASRYHFKVCLSQLIIAGLPEDRFPISSYYLYLSEDFINSLNEAMSRARQLGVAVRTTDFFNLSGDKSKSVMNCVFLQNGFTISWNGNVPLCCNTSLSELTFGNVFELGLENCINGDQFNTVRKYIKMGIYPTCCERCGEYNHASILAEYMRSNRI